MTKVKSRIFACEMKTKLRPSRGGGGGVNKLDAIIFEALRCFPFYFSTVQIRHEFYLILSRFIGLWEILVGRREMCKIMIEITGVNFVLGFNWVQSGKSASNFQTLLLLGITAKTTAS
jgi:hypothetical protein